ncbi:cytochrome c, partial [Verrucomicrobia bacterium]|nr:cytochrome c [Verrucomicrobiota bacterium]
SNTAMGMFTQLSERELEAVIVYIKTFSPKWKDDDLYSSPLALPEKPNWFDEPKERALRVMAGERLFTIACVPCHGQNADGNGPQAMTLLDARGRSIKPANLLFPHLRNGDSELDLVRVLMTGLNGTPMLSFAETLGPEEMWELAAYLHEKRQTALSK